MSLLLLHGEERFLIDRAAHTWLREARETSFSDLDVEVLDAPARLDGLRRSLNSVPFLAERRCVLVRDAPQLAERARRGADSADGLAEALETRSPTTDVCLVAHVRVAPTNPVLVLARREGRVVEHSRVKGRDLRAAVDAMVAARRVRLPRGAVEHLVLVSGGDLGVIDGELAKLAAMAADGAPVDLVDVRSLVAGAEQVETWDLLDRLVTPPHARGAAALEALLAGGASSQYVVSILAGQLREVLQVVDILAAGGRGSTAVAAELGLPPWRADRLLRWARQVDGAMVEGWLRALQRLDAAVKMGLADDAAGLRSIVLRAARELEAHGPARRA